MTNTATEKPLTSNTDAFSSTKRYKQESNDDDNDSLGWKDDANDDDNASIGPEIFDREGNDDEQQGIPIGPDSNLRYAADAHVEAELAKMDPSERERICFDVHGISRLPKETPELIEKSLGDFRDAIDVLLYQNHSKRNSSWFSKESEPDESGYGLKGIFSTRAYELALAQNKDYAEDPELWLAFLRTERFQNARDAAQRCMRWFQVKLDLFGAELLTHTITQDDLARLDATEGNHDPETATVTSLVDGYKQILPLRDHAGRLVFGDFVGNSCHDATKSKLCKLRRKFYMSMVAAEDPETQRQGAVMVWYAVGVTDAAPLDDWALVKALFCTIDCLPLRIEAVHSCHDSRWRYATKVALFRLTCGLYLSARTRVHVGDHSRCLFRLQTYGIPVATLPLSADGSFAVTRHANERLWRQRRAYERKHLASKPPLVGLVETDVVQSSSKIPKEPDLVPESQDDLNDEDIRMLLQEGNNSGIGSGIFDSSSFRTEQQEEETVTTEQPSETVTAEQPPSSIPEQQETEEKPKDALASAASAAVTSRPAAILLPGQFDVLLGRGAGYHRHSGNVRLRNAIEPRVQEHKSCKTPEEKVEMTLAIVREIQSRGGRFLKQDATLGWTEVSDHEARQKVGHTFRNMRAKSSGSSRKPKPQAKRGHPGA